MTRNPLFSTSQPIIRKVSDQVYSSPIPKNWPDIAACRDASSSRSIGRRSTLVQYRFFAGPTETNKVQVSTHTRSTLLPGLAAASWEAMARPVTPPAQPSPKMGRREHRCENSSASWREHPNSASRCPSTRRSQRYRHLRLQTRNGEGPCCRRNKQGCCASILLCADRMLRGSRTIRSAHNKNS